MFCQQCGKSIDDDSLFCSYCGFNFDTGSVKDTSSKAKIDLQKKTSSNSNLNNQSLKFDKVKIIEYSPYLLLTMIVLVIIYGLIPTSFGSKNFVSTSFEPNIEAEYVGSRDPDITDNTEASNNKTASMVASVIKDRKVNINLGSYVLVNNGRLSPLPPRYYFDMNTIIDFNDKLKSRLLSDSEISFLSNAYGENNVGVLTVTEVKNRGLRSDLPDDATIYAVKLQADMRSLGQDGVTISSYPLFNNGDNQLSYCTVNKNKNLECDFFLDVISNERPYRFELVSDSQNNITLKKMFTENSVSSNFSSDHLHDVLSAIELSRFAPYSIDDMDKYNFIFAKGEFINTVVEINSTLASLNKNDKTLVNGLIKQTLKLCFPEYVDFSSLNDHDKAAAYICTTKNYDKILSAVDDRNIQSVNISNDTESEFSNYATGDEDIQDDAWYFTMKQGIGVYFITNNDVLLRFECVTDFDSEKNLPPEITLEGKNGIEYSNFDIIIDNRMKYAFNLKGDNHKIPADSASLQKFFNDLKIASKIEFLSKNKTIGVIFPLKSTVGTVKDIEGSCVPSAE
jgi:hypothetical protein